MFFSKIVRKIPPFKNIYNQLDTLKKNNVELKEQLQVTDQKYKDLSKKYEKLLKRADYIWDVEQRFEKNMTEHYQNIGGQIKGIRLDISGVKKNATNMRQDIRATKEMLDARHEGVIARIDGNHAAIAERERLDYIRLEEMNKQLVKDIEYYYYKGLHPDQYESSIKEWYYERTGEQLDLQNPLTYNEKIQWMKLHDSTKMKADLADKYLVREYVRQKIGEKYLVPLLGVWENVNDIAFDDMPEQFVLKANHGCGYNIIVQDKKNLDVAETKKKLSKWLKTNFAYSAGLELHYKMIHPVVIAEQYIENLNGELNDYKVFCFDGKARYIMFLKDRQSTLKMAFYDTQWNRMPFVYSHERLIEDIPKPENLEELIEISERLAEGFSHVRVDFYRLNDGQYKFGELTFTSFSGACIWDPPEYNRILGDMITLPQKGI